jgi:uncharacterized pyridoxamine 5'-phosphate oxidase family protein
MGYLMENSVELRQLLTNLFASQRFAVLATESDGQPYGNLVAFVEVNELKNILFATARNTRKYSSMIDNRKIALLIDSRTNQMSDLKNAIAVTAIGTVEEVDSTKRVNLAKLYIQKHPYLTDFISNTANALMQITISDYILANFDKVQVLQVGDNSSGN